MRTVQGWKNASRVLESWRKKLTSLQIALKRPRVIDVVPVDFITGEPVHRHGQPRKKFKAELVYFTKDDLTLRRRRGALLIIDTYELDSLSNGKIRLLP